MADKPKKSSLFLVGLALLAGLVAGAITVYVSETQSGNGSSNTQSASAAHACSLSDDSKTALKSAAAGEMQTMRIADKPVPLADVGFQLASGEETTFGAWKDRVVLLNIWATWCGPCREEMPDLAELQKLYGGDDFEVLALNVDRNGGAKPQRFLDEINANALNLYLDPSNKSFQALRSKGLVFGLPTTMIVDTSGCVQGVLAGIAHWGSDDAKNLVEVAKKALRAES
ncbi:MAG: TlpA disulfide reductase family protein [Pseudomonadota bacterium]